MTPNYLHPGPNRTDILDLCMAMALTLGPEVFARQSLALKNRPDQTATRYAPMGSRSFGPTRANMVHGAGYAATANDTVVVRAMIETREALTNLDAILRVEGIDGVYVGPSDLGLSLGYEATLDPTAPDVLTAIAEIATRTKAAGKIAGVHTGSPAMIHRSFAQGYDFASLLTDARMFTTAIATQLAAVRQTTVETVKGY